MICPSCKSSSSVKNGRRKLRFETVQTYQCKQCHHRFQQRKLTHKTYKPSIIYYALILYHQGHTFDKTKRLVNLRFKVNVGISTIHSWVSEFKDLCPIHNRRDEISFYDPLIFQKRFDHENLAYVYRLHYGKMERDVKTSFPRLYSYLKRFEKGCPDAFFEIGKRCSQPPYQINVEPQTRMNLACEMARFSVLAAPTNYHRHDMVETFMITTDLATIACEIPVWYWDKTIDEGITGHIDILQIRNGLVYILDFKPDAKRKSVAAGQLFHYARALSFRTRIPLISIRCAWFDEHQYFEFSPHKYVGGIEYG